MVAYKIYMHLAGTDGETKWLPFHKSFQIHFFKENLYILIQITFLHQVSFKCHLSSNDNNSALI